jgi:L-arabinose isomerase
MMGAKIYSLKQKAWRLQSEAWGNGYMLLSDARHTRYNQNLNAEGPEDFASIGGIEFVLIGKNTDIYQLKNELRWNEMYYKLKT